MKTGRESLCCLGIGLMARKVEEGGHSCIIEHDGFQGNCLNPHVLEASFWEILHENGPIGDDEPLNM